MTIRSIISYRTRVDAADDNQRAIEKVFADLGGLRPDGLRYASFRLDDGVSFVHIVEADGPNPLLDLSAFQEFQAGLTQRLAATPVNSVATLIGSYRAFDS